MLTILLIDDEDLELEGLETMINGMNLECTICGKARNAFQGIDLAKQYHPDVILSDIKMPKMEGTEMVAKIQELGIKSFLVFISGYQDFSAAQQAIRLGARSFLLKPVNRESLRTILLQAGAELRQTQQENDRVKVMGESLERLTYMEKWTFTRRLILNDSLSKEEILVEADRLKMPLQDRKLAVVLLHMYLHNEEEKYWEGNSAALWNDIVEHDNAFLPVILTNGDIGFLFAFPNIMSKDAINNHLIAAGDHILEIAIPNIPTRLNVGISEISEDVTQIYTLVRQARTVVRQGFYNGYGKIFLYEENSAAASKIVTKSPENIKDILSSIAQGDKDGYAHLLRRLLSSYDVTINREIVRGICIDIISQAQRLCIESGLKNFETESMLYTNLLMQENMDRTLDYMLEYGSRLCEAFLQKRQNQNTQLVDQIERILNTEYKLPLSIDEIAQRVYLSSSYISRVYKNYTGETILDRLQSVRMKRRLNFCVSQNIVSMR